MRGGIRMKLIPLCLGAAVLLTAGNPHESTTKEEWKASLANLAHRGIHHCQTKTEKCEVLVIIRIQGESGRIRKELIAVNPISKYPNSK